MSTAINYRLILSSDPVFRLLHEGFVLGGAATLNRQVQVRQEASFDERRVEARILRKLKAIAIPATNEKGEPLVFRQTGARCLALKPGEHTMELTTVEYATLKDFIKAVPWDTGRMDDAEDMVDFVLRAAEVAAPE